MSFSEFMIRALPFAVFAFLIYLLSQRFLVDYQSEKGVYWRGMLMKFALWPVFTYAFYLTLVNKKIPYLPTSKRGSSTISIFFWPLLIYLALLIFSVSFHFYSLQHSSESKLNFEIQQQTLGMLSFSIIACLQHISAIILILTSSKVQHTDAWDDVNKYLT
jgi:cellulose synthase (UDP-forming)